MNNIPDVCEPIADVFTKCSYDCDLDPQWSKTV